MTDHRTEDPLLTGARRDAKFTTGMFVTALVYTLGVCWTYGYNRPVESLTFVLGFPDWVFWGIVVPWAACTLISAWYALGVMTDQPLE
uniref:DUF997 family protein n=1 Tax=Schlesneria paludicola TaxID=360056 RepID=A0A7C2K399_9PLAN